MTPHIASQNIDNPTRTAAEQIAHRIAAEAIWSNDACTWVVQRPDFSTPGSRQVVSSPADGTVYVGSAGIALFLAEAYRACNDTALAEAAAGGVEHALRSVGSLPVSSFGFHSGRVGIAFAACRVGMLIRHEALVAAAEHVLAPMRGKERLDVALDVIAGAAGAIPALLSMAVEHPTMSSAFDIAVELGNHLLDAAIFEPIGWSWSPKHNTLNVRSLTGLSHGAAGVGHAFIELYSITQRNEYAYAAEQAFAYERQFYSKEHANWPDFRHIALGNALADPARLRAAYLQGVPAPEFTVQFASNWCHGAPGIGLTRLRAYEVLGENTYKEEALAAVQTTMNAVQDERRNYSLCHGHAGNCETLMYAASVLGSSTALEAASQRLTKGIAEYEFAGVDWPCGTTGGARDASLMLGDSGIGYALLRLSEPSVPSLLLPGRLAVEPSGPISSRPTARVHEYRNRYIARFLQRTLQAIYRLHGAEFGVGEYMVGSHSNADSEIHETQKAIEHYIESLPSPFDRAQCRDAYALDRNRISVARLGINRTTAALAGLTMPRTVADLHYHQHLVSREHGKLVSTRWDWDSWLLTEEHGQQRPSCRTCTHFVWPSATGVETRKLSNVMAEVVEMLVTPKTVANVIEHLAATMDADHSVVDKAIKAELLTAIRAGAIVMVFGQPGQCQ